MYVQHLLGIGHLARTARIAAALRDRGVRTSIVKGGMPVDGFDAPGVESIQLAPVRGDPDDLSRLLDAAGRPLDDAGKARRRDELLAVLARRRPEILVIEAYPFGRRAMRFELTPLLERARGAGVRVIAASVRDILQESRKPGRAAETVETVLRFFDLVLVHGDAAFAPLSASFPLADRLGGRVAHTGLVGPSPRARPVAEHAVIVSVGGGAVGERLIEAAIRAAPRGPLAEAPWLVLTGPNMPIATRAALAAQAPPNVEFRDFAPDLPARLAGARLSISQAGYNTVADLLSAGCAAVLAPFERGGETEQLTRARLLEKSGRAVMVREDELTPETMAAAIVRALAWTGDAGRMALDGAGRSADMLLSRLNARSDSVADASASFAISDMGECGDSR